MLDVAEGLVAGVMIAMVWLYAMRTRAAYPSWMLMGYKYPWLVLAYVLLVMFAWRWSPLVASCLLLIGLAVAIDVYTFGQPRPQGPLRGPWENTDAEEEGGRWMDMRSEMHRHRASENPNLPGPSPATIPLPEPNYPMFASQDVWDFPGAPMPF